jgi:UDP-N-acetylmuramoylalanine--D-glutamate ligase
VAVGGTNGKSTTTKLCAEILAADGRSVFVGGNYGTPVCQAASGRWDVLVVEVSSFQLERAPTFQPRVSVLLNISEDHLDRYPDFAAYAAAKGNAFRRQSVDDFAVVPAGDAVCEAQAARGRGRLLRYGSATAGAELNYALSGANVVESATARRVDLAPTALCGAHNFTNAAAAIAAARALGVDWAAVERALCDFEPLPHRMARVATLAGITYYDDSKGTNVGAAVTALRGLSEPRAVLLAGGRDKQGSYAPLVEALRERGRALVVLGEAAEAIAAAADGALPIHRARSMLEAVTLASTLARPGDAVLLSPACSSFDMYQSYAERGDDFQRSVRGLVCA